MKRSSTVLACIRAYRRSVSLPFASQRRPLSSSTPGAGSGGDNSPEPVITAAPAPPLKNITIHSLRAKKRKKEPITMVTAYDFPSAVHVDKAGIDVLLVGDSVGMVELGYDTTLPVTMDEMVHHCKAVSRGCRRPLLLGDMPFGSYEACPVQAVNNAARLLKEGSMDAVKMEGGKQRAESIARVVDSGIAVMGHIGLTPQSYSALGGFRAQGKSAKDAVRLVEDALAIQEAGVFGMVIECVPPVVARVVSELLTVPTIGIGSGPYTDGQVLVYHDMLGMMQHYHHAQFTPRFCKQYATVGQEIQDGLLKYKEEVKNRTFPDDNFSPYQIKPEQEAEFLKQIAEQYSTKPSDDGKDIVDEETIKVY